ncbi:formate dehydrogenase subunit alpha precursor [bacterium BMS3Abin14]|nr:formate dehydrogenase subunit alpha precursor [bacterium BMS3Abin14]
MTNHWIDIRNSDVILIDGSNAAENHPISFKWVDKARENGAKLISVDPRFTRTSSKADIYAPMRSGTDIAFLGGMIKYIMDNELFHRDYVRMYTNGPFIVNTGFKMPGDLDGVFSGYDPKKRKYDKKSWAFVKDGKGVIKKDPGMKDPMCVLQLLKKQFSRYTLDKVSAICGTPKRDLLEVYKTYTSTGTPARTGTIMYAMGWTQHTVGTQNIRTMAIIQLLLGNIGMSGGGVNALRGESNVQGSTDHCLLFHILPGYLKTPRAKDSSFARYNSAYTPKTSEPYSANWWANYPKYSASLLRAHFGKSASLETQYQWLPKLDDGQNASWLMLFDEMYKGKFTGFFAWGQNPACSGANSAKTRQALTKLDWMVNVNLFDNETGSFWRAPGMDPSQIKTEVFLLPCAMSFEKEGSITNSGRWGQWRYAAVAPPAPPDSEILNELQFRVKKLYQEQGGVYPDPILNMTWDYGPKGPDGKVRRMNTHLIAKEINGYFLEERTIKGKTYKPGDLVPSFAFLQADGSTSSGNWLYSQSYNAGGNNMARRGKSDPTGIGLYNGWSWCWPVNRRIIYNRASVDEYGKPWAPQKPVIYWNGAKWIGDVPDGGWPPLRKPDGTWNEKTKLAYIMKPAGVGRLFGPGRAEGPFPEHYEPLESPLEKNLMSPQRINPVIKIFSGKLDQFANSDDRYPIVATTYRVTEHWQTGVLSRWLPWQVEMQPANFLEISVELAREKGIGNGDKVVVSSVRSSVDAVAIVTKRFQPFKVAGTTVHQVGLPWCFGWATTKENDVMANGKEYSNHTFGDSSNLLTPSVGDANTMIPETKAFMVNVKKA